MDESISKAFRSAPVLFQDRRPGRMSNIQPRDARDFVKPAFYLAIAGQANGVSVLHGSQREGASCVHPACGGRIDSPESHPTFVSGASRADGGKWRASSPCREGCFAMTWSVRRRWLVGGFTDGLDHRHSGIRLTVARGKGFKPGGETSDDPRGTAIAN